MPFTFVPRPQSDPAPRGGVGMGAGGIGQGIAQIIFKSQQRAARKKNEEQEDFQFALGVLGPERALSSPAKRERFENLFGIPVGVNEDGTPDLPPDIADAAKEWQMGVMNDPNSPFFARVMGMEEKRKPSAELIARERVKADKDIARTSNEAAYQRALVAAGAPVEAAEIRARSEAAKDKDKPENKSSGMFLRKGKITRRWRGPSDIPLTIGGWKTVSGIKAQNLSMIKTQAEVDKLEAEHEKIVVELASNPELMKLLHDMRMADAPGVGLAMQGVLGSILSEGKMTMTEGMIKSFDIGEYHWFEKSIFEEALALRNEADARTVYEEAKEEIPLPAHGGSDVEPLYTPSGIPYTPIN